MRNIKLKIAYDGTNYCGWQVQKGRQSNTIQEIIETALREILQEKIALIGSGRTDSGVHALGQVANFKTNSRLGADNIGRALNSVLPADIRIIDTCDVSLRFHARFDAKSKLYRYLLLSSKVPDPFLGKFSWHVSFPLDLKLMAKEARCLRGRHNFKSFCASRSKVCDTVRNIKDVTVRIEPKSFFLGLPVRGSLVIISIEADGFLYNMARNIVGTLVDIGRGHLNKGDMAKILKARNRKLAGVTSAAKGLYLCEVRYE